MKQNGVSTQPTLGDCGKLVSWQCPWDQIALRDVHEAATTTTVAVSICRQEGRQAGRACQQSNRQANKQASKQADNSSSIDGPGERCTTAVCRKLCKTMGSSFVVIAMHTINLLSAACAEACSALGQVSCLLAGCFQSQSSSSLVTTQLVKLVPECSSMAPQDSMMVLGSGEGSGNDPLTSPEGGAPSITQTEA